MDRRILVALIRQVIPVEELVTLIRLGQDRAIRFPQGLRVHLSGENGMLRVSVIEHMGPPWYLLAPAELGVDLEEMQ